MRRVERLFQIVRLMQAAQGALCAREIARALEVSQRTVYRDIAHLQAEGLAIEGVAGLGFVVTDAFTLPALNLDRDERAALSLGLAFARATGDAALRAGAQTAQGKLGLASPVALTGRMTRRPPRSFAALRRAIEAGGACAIRYRDGAGRVSQREITPLTLLASPNGWLVDAHCALRGARRVFDLARIEHVGGPA